MKKFILIFLLLFFSEKLLSKESFLKNDSCSFWSTIYWLQDDLTIPFYSVDTPENEIPNYASGIRFLFEPLTTYLIQGSNKNTIDNTSTLLIPKFAVEVNMLYSWLSAQICIIFPSSVKFESKSPITKDNSLFNPDNSVSVTWGYGIGLSWLNGIFTVGYLRLNYDTRDFQSIEKLSHSSMVYISVQPIESAKIIIKRFIKK